jgi:hypothetical protein
MKAETGYRISKIFKHIYTAIFWIAICGSCLFVYDFFKEDETTIVGTLTTQEMNAKPEIVDIPFRRNQMIGEDIMVVRLASSYYGKSIVIYSNKRPGRFIPDDIGAIIEIDEGDTYCMRVIIKNNPTISQWDRCFPENELARDENIKYLEYLRDKYKGE